MERTGTLQTGCRNAKRSTRMAHCGMQEIQACIHRTSEYSKKYVVKCLLELHKQHQISHNFHIHADHSWWCRISGMSSRCQNHFVKKKLASKKLWHLSMNPKSHFAIRGSCYIISSRKKKSNNFDVSAPVDAQKMQCKKIFFTATMIKNYNIKINVWTHRKE